MRPTWPIALIVCMSAVVGCGGSPAPDNGVVSSPADDGTSPTADTSAATGEVAGVAERFLQAILRGDGATATRWLTQTAAQRATVDPTVLATLGMRFTELRVEQVQRVTEDEAIAQCLLREAAGATPEEICCLLRRESQGWRVMGLACEGGPGREPAMIDFERPATPAGGGPAKGDSDPSRFAQRPAGTTPAGTEPMGRTAEADSSAQRR
jgi:hypothetical protein